jgi:hypothetical protein
MERWGTALYGQPCRECGFDWSTAPVDAVDFVEAATDALKQIVGDAAGDQRGELRAWSVSEYVSHMGDNLRNWAERIQAGRLASVREVGGYDPDELAVARRYESIPLQVAMWSLELSCRAWGVVVREALSEDVVLVHVSRGEQRAADVARNNCHDVWHHLWDIEQIVSVGRA